MLRRICSINWTITFYDVFMTPLDMYYLEPPVRGSVTSTLFNFFGFSRNLNSHVLLSSQIFNDCVNNRSCIADGKIRELFLTRVTTSAVIRTRGTRTIRA